MALLTRSDLDLDAISDGKTPHAFAVKAGYHEIAELLSAAASDRKFGPNNTIGDQGKTRLMDAIERGDHPLTAQLLESPGLDPTLTDAQGRTALYYAAREDNREAVRLLLDHPRIDPNRMTERGATALYIAVQKNNMHVVNALLAHPAIDVNIPLDQTGATPLYLAAKNGCIGIVRALVAHPRIVADQPTIDGASPLWIAAASGHAEIVRILTDHPGLKLNHAYNGKTATAIARDKGNDAIADALSAAYEERTTAAIENGEPIPFDGVPLNIAAITSGAYARQAIAAWREQEVPERDLRQLRQDIRAYTIHGSADMPFETINTRYRHFFAPAIQIENSELRLNVARLLPLLPP